MYLKSLTISADTRVIREIRFRNGINLIVDETPSINGKETGNNVGKTTVLMLVDFCLGASAKHIYTDPENRREEYAKVKNFLVDNRVLVSLVLADDLSNDDSREVLLERNFLARGKSVRRINGVQKTEDEYEAGLTDLLFPGHYGKKPTFRQIIAHNIRYKDLSINNTLKHLDAYTRDDEYETLYLFLLGCDFADGDSKQEILSKIRLEQTFKNRLEEVQTKSAYETALSLLEGEIERLNKRKSALNLNEEFEADLDEINAIKYRLNLIGSEVGKLQIRRGLIEEAKQDLIGTTPKIDVQQLRAIYSQATVEMSGIQKTFEDLLNFHNRMITEKLNFITKDLPALNEAIELKSSEITKLVEIEAGLALKLSQSASFEKLETLIAEINELYRRKGEYEKIVEQLSEVESNLESLNGRLNKIDNQLFDSAFEMKIKEQIDKFNKYFASISQTLYGEQYALKMDKGTNRANQRMYKFSAFNTNFSSGKKQGEISCFDIAYTLFADSEKIPCMHFLLNDKKELMHDNQLLRIAQLVNDKGVQFVASILRDKLPEGLNKKDYFIVQLSENEKLFKIEGAQSQK